MDRNSRTALIVFCLVMITLSQGCNPTADQSQDHPEVITPTDNQTPTAPEEPGENNQPTDPEASGDQAGREAMVFVVDPNYDPIPNAEIGTDGNYADRFGVFLGEVLPNEAGWVLVQAPGYVTNYAKPSPFSGEYDLYFVTLAPIEVAYHYQNESSTSGVTQSAQGKVMLEPGALNNKDGFLQLTEIDPRLSLDDAWAELGNPYDSFYSLDISAWSLAGDAVNLNEGQTALINIRDTEHEAEHIIRKSFDAESGTWIEQVNICTRIDSETIQCSLNHFSMHTFLEDNLEDWQLEAEEIDDFRILFYTIGAIYKKGEEAGTLTDAEAETISLLFDKLVEVVRDFVKRNRNETGKAMLIYTSQLAQTSGIEGGEAIANELIQEAQDLVKEMAKKLEENADCGHTDEIMHLIEQGQKLGGSAKVAADELMNKVSDQLQNCQIWIGDIHYMFFLLDEFPELEGNWLLQATNLTWHEFHSIRIGINPITNKLSGTSKVRSVMTPASYLAEIGSDSCGIDKHYLDLETNPGVGFTTLDFDGTYLNQVWTVGPPQEGDFTPLLLFMHQHGYFGCPKQVMELSNTQMFTYRSQLLHGFFGVPQPPSLEEMLNNGIMKKDFLGNDIIRGTEDITYTSGVNRVPIMPVDHAHLSWRFQQLSRPEVNQ